MLNEQERVTLAALGLVALCGWGVLLWQRQRPPSFDVAQDGALSEVEGPPLTIEGAVPTAQAAQWNQAVARAKQIDVNTAGIVEFERLPGVGPTLARRIVDDRNAHGPFQSTEELSRVKGIGPKTLSALQGYLTINE